MTEQTAATPACGGGVGTEADVDATRPQKPATGRESLSDALAPERQYVLQDTDGGWYADVAGVMDDPDPTRTREQAYELAFARLLRHNQRLVEEFRAENARLTTALAAAEAARDAALAAIRDLLWILHHDEIKGMESNAWIHGMRYSDKFLAEANRRREAAEQLAGWGPTDG